jgi:hypothetical protein
MMKQMIAISVAVLVGYHVQTRADDLIIVVPSQFGGIHGPAIPELIPIDAAGSIQRGANALSSFNNAVQSQQIHQMHMRQMEAETVRLEQDAQMNASIMRLRDSAMAVQPMIEMIDAGDLQGAADAMRQYGAQMQSRGRDSTKPMQGAEDIMSGDPARIQRVYSELEGVMSQARQFGVWR